MDLSRLQSRFKILMDAYQQRTQRDWKDIACEVGIKATRLSEIMNNRRNLTGLYLEPFIWQGIIKMSDIYDGKAIDPKEKQFWKRMSRAERADLLDIVIRVEEAGLDVKEILLDALTDKLKS